MAAAKLPTTTLAWVLASVRSSAGRCSDYVDGDDVFVIGFSRGAFTARSLSEQPTRSGMGDWEARGGVASELTGCRTGCVWAWS
jgi:hypothetical protein